MLLRRRLQKPTMGQFIFTDSPVTLVGANLDSRQVKRVVRADDPNTSEATSFILPKVSLRESLSVT